MSGATPGGFAIRREGTPQGDRPPCPLRELKESYLKIKQYMSDHDTVSVNRFRHR